MWSARDTNFFFLQGAAVVGCCGGSQSHRRLSPTSPEGFFWSKWSCQASVQHLHPCSAEVQKTRQSCCHQFLPTLFELNRILLLSCTICTDSSVNSWSKLTRSRQKGACCFSPGLDPAQNNCVDCFIPCLAVQGLEIPHKRAQHTET